MPVGLVTWDYPKVPAALITQFVVKFRLSLFLGEGFLNSPGNTQGPMGSLPLVSESVSAADHVFVATLPQQMASYDVDIMAASHFGLGVSDSFVIGGEFLPGTDTFHGVYRKAPVQQRIQ